MVLFVKIYGGVKNTEYNYFLNPFLHSARFFSPKLFLLLNNYLDIIKYNNTPT